MNWKDSDIKRILKKCVYFPTMEIDDVSIPLYKYTEQFIRDSGMIDEYTKAANKKAKYSPNCVKAIILANDGCVKILHDGTEIMSKFSNDGWRTLEEANMDIIMGKRKGIQGILDFALLEKMNNLEEIYVSKQILMLSGLKMKLLDGMTPEALTELVVSTEFAQRLFGTDVPITEEFRRIATIGIGDINVTLNNFKGNWELVLGADNKPVLANRNWVVQEKIYIYDEKLYRYVSKYMKDKFGV